MDTRTMCSVYTIYTIYWLWATTDPTGHGRDVSASYVPKRTHLQSRAVLPSSTVPTPGTEASYRRWTEATKHSPDTSRCARALSWLPSISPSCFLSKLATSRSTGAASSPGTWASSPASFPPKTGHSCAWQPRPLTEFAPLELVART